MAATVKPRRNGVKSVKKKGKSAVRASAPSDDEDGEPSDAELPARKRKRDKDGGRKGKRDGRDQEEAEIRDLELRLATEGPRRGSGAIGVDAGGATDKSGAEGGPTLTAHLFKELPISKKTLAGLASSKFTKMTEIQRSAIPHALCGRDLLGEARTGSGKTLAFLVPLAELLFRRRWTRIDGLGALAVSPTRELAYQIFQVLTSMGSQHDFSAGCVVGGRDLQEEQQTVMNMNILIATPGRLLQHLDESPGFDASTLQMLVMDEADRILDFGFQETMHHILAHLPTERQTLLFSATLHTSVHRLGRAALRSPEMVSVHKNAASRTPDRLKQVYMTMPLDKKVDTLFSFLRSHSQKKVIVFVSACKQVRFLYEAYRQLKPGPAVMELHGRQSLQKRMCIFKEFTERERAVALLCTDIAARGVDFPAVDWVVQMDCPDSVDSYIHRVGRTARYESSGNSALFLCPSEEAFVEKLRNARITIKSIATKAGKVHSIQQKLNALLAGDGAIKHLAQKAFLSYVRSISLMKDKSVFKASEVPHEEFALSLGLVLAPTLKGGFGDGDAEDAGAVKAMATDECDVDANPFKKMKNQSALQRLKEKIASKRKVVAAADTAGGDDDEEREEREELQGGAGTKSKKLSRWERRQQRVAAAKTKVATDAVGDDEADDFLAPVAAPDGDAATTSAASSAAPLLSARQKRMRIGRDGVAKDAVGTHRIFNAGSSEAAGELAQVADELRGEGFGTSSSSSSRSAFLKSVAEDLAKRDSSDAAVSRARIHERHQKQRRKNKQERRDDDEAGGMGFATLDGGDDSDVDEGDVSADSPPPSPVPQRQSKKPPAPKKVAKGEAGEPEQASSSSTAAAGGGLNDLEALEREALSRLSSGGLFG